jgi:hypothetical protein
MGNRRLGRKRLRKVQQQSYSATDEWGLVRPAMVPGFARNVRVACIGQMHGYGFEDLTDVPVDGQTTAVWLREDENSAALALVANDADFTDGGVTLTPGSGAHDNCGFLMAAKTFTCTTDKPWWVETQFKLADIDDCEFFFGVHESTYATGTLLNDETAGAGKDAVGFDKVTHSSGAITCRASFNALEFTGTGLTVTANNDVVSLGIHWDGKGQCKFYGAFAATGTEVGALPLLQTFSIQPDQAMGLTLQYVHTTAAADDPITVNYVRGAWTI